MDQDVGWWVRVALDGWERREGPRYRQIAAAIADAMATRLIDAGDRLPAERMLADALGVSRGTTVRAYEGLAEAGLVERRQGAGTFIRPRPAWMHAPKETPASGPLLRRLSSDADVINLSLGVPAGTDHLPPVEGAILESLDGLGRGLDAAGLPELRRALAEYLTRRLGLPTTPDMLIVTSGAQNALSLITAALMVPGRPVVAGCPANPGLVGAVAAQGSRVVGVPVDAHGIDVRALERAAASGAVIYVDPPAHDPTGAVLSAGRRAALLDVARRREAVVVEDLSQAGLDLGRTRGRAVPLGANDDSVVVVGSLSKMFWAGLRVGWIRSPQRLYEHLLRLRTAADLAPSVPSQLIAARLLRAADRAWRDELRATLKERRDLLLALIGERLPSWHVDRPHAGLSTWVTLPVDESEDFAHLAATRHGIIAASGVTACVDGRHLNGLRLSFAESPQTIEAAVDRLADAWAEYTRRLASTA